MTKKYFWNFTLLLGAYLFFYSVYRTLGRVQFAFSFPYAFLGVQIITSYLGAILLFKSSLIKQKIIRIIAYFIIGYIIGLIVLTLHFFWMEFIYYPYILYYNDNYFIPIFKQQNWDHGGAIIRYLHRLYFGSLSFNYGFWLMCGLLGIGIEIIQRKDVLDIKTRRS